MLALVIRSWERRLAGQQRIRDTAERVDIRCLRSTFSDPLLRCSVLWGQELADRVR